MDGADPFASGAALWRAIGGFELVNEPADGGSTWGTPGERVARDAELLEAVRLGDAPATARIWENGRCLVATRADARLPGFAKAARTLGEEGWPVLVRESGGTTVPHDAGILHLSLVFRPPSGARCTLESVYGALALPIRDALASLGLHAELGPAPGSFCDGRFNLCVAGRKVAGTAQRWRGRPGAATDGRGAVLAHALLLVDADLDALTERVNGFYARAGSERRARATASATVASLLPEGTYASGSVRRAVRRAVATLGPRRRT